MSRSCSRSGAAREIRTALFESRESVASDCEVPMFLSFDRHKEPIWHEVDHTKKMVGIDPVPIVPVGPLKSYKFQGVMTTSKHYRIEVVESRKDFLKIILQRKQVKETYEINLNDLCTLFFHEGHLFIMEAEEYWED